MIEKEIGSAIKEVLGYDVEYSNWDILGNKEIGIIIPEANLLIEVNGLYWHSCSSLDSSNEVVKNKHLNKTLMAMLKGYNLIHVTDCEWSKYRDNILELILVNTCNLVGELSPQICDSHNLKVEKISNTEFGIIHNVIISFENKNDHIMITGIKANKHSEYNNLNIVPISYVYREQVYCIIREIGKTYQLPVKIKFDLMHGRRDILKVIGFVDEELIPPEPIWVTPSRIATSQEIANKTEDQLFFEGYRKYWNCGYWVMRRETKI